MGYRESYNPDHPLAGKNGYVADHRAVLYEKIGPGDSQCFWCQRVVRWLPDIPGKINGDRLISDHLNFDREDASPENLVPACGRCNILRRQGDPLRDGEFIVKRRGHSIRARIVKCRGCHEEFISEVTILGVPTRKFHSRACATAARWKSGSLTSGKRKEIVPSYRYITAHGHPLASKKGRLAEHRFALYSAIGEGPHACHWCKSKVRWDGKRKDPEMLVPDHLDGAKSNNDPENLVASCTSCNISRAHKKYDPLEQKCAVCSVTFFVTANRSVQNPKWGLYCGRSCRSKGNFSEANKARDAAGLTWGRRIGIGEEVFVASDGMRYRAAHVACKHCGGDIVYAKSGYKPKFCNSRCYGNSMKKQAAA